MKTTKKVSAPKMKVVKQQPVDPKQFEALDNFTNQLFGRVDSLMRRVHDLETRIAKLEEGGSWRQLVNKLRGF
jgi:hypothetical protein